MIVLEQGLNGYEADGLNGGLKISKFIKTNIKSIRKDVSIKNAIKVAKVALPVALSVVPIVGNSVGGAVGKVLNKITTNADGSANLVGRTIDTVQTVANSNVGKSVIAFAKPLVKSTSARLLQQKGTIPTDEQLATLAENKGTTAQQELDNLVNAQSAGNPAPASTDNTMLIVGGVVAVGIAYAILK